MRPNVTNFGTRFELFLLGEGEKKITETPFPRKSGPYLRNDSQKSDNWTQGMSNCSDFTLKKEDHTLGNLVSEHLKKHPNVLMAGYKSKLPPPLRRKAEDVVVLETKGRAS